MISVILSGLAFLCPLLGAGIGMALRQRLPEHHLSREFIDVIKLASGVGTGNHADPEQKAVVHARAGG